MRKWIMLSLTLIVLTATGLTATSFQTKKKNEKDAAPAQTEAKQETKKESKAMSGKIPEGVVLRGAKATLKSGYEWVGQTGNTVSMRRMGMGNISGTFSCACQTTGSGAGVCQLSITKEAALCAGSCNDCRMEIVVDPKLTGIAKKSKDKKSAK